MEYLDTGDILSDVMSESAVTERLEVLIDKAVLLMEKIPTTEDVDEREGLHMELLADMDESATLMSTHSDSRILLNVANHVVSPPGSPLEIIYSFLLECFASEYYIKMCPAALTDLIQLV